MITPKKGGRGGRARGKATVQREDEGETPKPPKRPTQTLSLRERQINTSELVLLQVTQCKRGMSESQTCRNVSLQTMAKLHEKLQQRTTPALVKLYTEGYVVGRQNGSLDLLEQLTKPKRALLP